MISIFDPAICSYNIGNEIILDAVMEVVDELFPKEHIIHIPSTDISKNARNYCSCSKFSFIGGTNILSNKVGRGGQFDLNLHNLLILKNIILMGCGWFQYQSQYPSSYARWAWNRILSHNFYHSVRDSYTQKKLNQIGIKSINTGCPTLWKLTPNIIEKIAIHPKKKVVITITDYNKDYQRDMALLQLCESCYPEGIVFFPQGTGDIDYINTLGYANKVHILPPRLKVFNKVLNSGEVDYVGTRLHAGIRALQRSVRAFIVGVDNRALEIKKDIGLPVLLSNESELWSAQIKNEYKLKLAIPFDKIARWKNQFV